MLYKEENPVGICIRSMKNNPRSELKKKKKRNPPSNETPNK